MPLLQISVINLILFINYLIITLSQSFQARLTVAAIDGKPILRHLPLLNLTPLNPYSRLSDSRKAISGMGAPGAREYIGTTSTAKNLSFVH